eukprot:1637630-Pyramimonas_sp.AAC.2
MLTFGISSRARRYAKLVDFGLSRPLTVGGKAFTMCVRLVRPENIPVRPASDWSGGRVYPY